MDTQKAVLVKSFDDADAFIALDPQTGRFEEVTRDQLDAHPARGLAHVEDGRLAALYVNDGALTLQIGAGRWRLGSPLVQVELARSTDRTINTFRVKVANRTEGEVTYRSPRGDALNQADPSFDALDEELQDFYLWVTRNAQDPGWIEDLRHNWSSSAGA